MPQPGQNFNLSGKFACGGLCDASFLGIKLVRGDSIADLGFIDLTDDLLNVAIPSEFFNFPGEYKIRLVSQCGDNNCTCEFTFIVPETCDCRCDDFNRLTLRQGTEEYLPFCGRDTIQLDCPIEDLSLSGFFGCQGMACNTDGQVNWTLSQPNGTLITNSTNIGDFQIDFAAALVQEAGFYTLELGSQCGTSGCNCSIVWEQPDCDPCACPVETFDFTYQLDCNQVLFDFSQVESCDTIRINFGDGTGEMLVGGHLLIIGI